MTKQDNKSYTATATALGIDEDNFDVSNEPQQDEEFDQETGKLKEEVEKTREQLMRALAEVENIRRIAKRDIGNAHKYALKPFIESLLPVMDSLEQGMAAVTDNQVVIEGMNLTYKIMLDVLKKYGVEQLDPVGNVFDPEHHEAISIQENAEVEPNTVLHVVQKGYKLNERVIRAARVIVAKK